MHGGHGAKGPDRNGTGGPPGTGGGAGTSRGGARWPGALLEAAPFVVGLAVTVAIFLGTRDKLGDRIATHFSGGGTADDWAATSSYPWVCLALFGGLALLFGLGTALPGASLAARSAWTATGWGTAGLLGYLLSAVLVVNAGAVADGTEARLSWVQLVAGLGAALLAAAAGALVRRLLPSAWRGPERGPLPGAAERLTLRPGERAGWSAHNTSAVLTGIGAGTFLLGAGLLAAGLVGAGLPLLLAGLLTFALSAVRVTVDRHGLTVAAGYLPWPRTRIALDQVATARAQHVRALEWGGWGYRVSPRGTGVILHSGEALVVRREDGRDFAVTTRDARTAAALLNTLAADGDGSPRPGGG
ncbi:DUF1648 domain-containing protein [Streptomyces sp. AM 3-1-1]|uniref:DUF1648 domain-containing protein n=1 Tax=Streptomyces sp. AM 3-1-1 TaxID=3028711 RepID=UPI0023B8B061|nr:DUF1648 domain-containing protein [Streptomyces sp. AM 3-1-1]WEH29757.1 DUF1648 domain-containing protein [Streptomyces sp. AM 3-1-1]